MITATIKAAPMRSFRNAGLGMRPDQISFYVLRAASVLLVVLTVINVFRGFNSALLSRSFAFAAEPVGYTALGMVTLALAVVVARMAHRLSLRASAYWIATYAVQTLRTPAGEAVRALDASMDGAFVGVEFEDGYYARYLYAELSSAWQKSDLLQRLSANKWKTLSGKTGIVRIAVETENGKCHLALKLEDGVVREYALSELTPVV
jgi:hypothetical protein